MHFEMKEGLAMAFPYGEEFISPFLMARLRGGAVPGTAAMRAGATHEIFGVDRVDYLAVLLYFVFR